MRGGGGLTLVGKAELLEKAVRVDGVRERVDPILQILVLRGEVLEHQLHLRVLVGLAQRALGREEGEVGACHVLVGGEKRAEGVVGGLDVERELGQQLRERQQPVHGGLALCVQKPGRTEPRGPRLRGTLVARAHRRSRRLDQLLEPHISVPLLESVLS